MLSILQIYTLYWLLRLTVAQSGGECMIDLVMVVDVSGSIQDTDIPGQDTNWFQMQKFMGDVIQGLNIGRESTRVGLVSFGNKGVLEFTLNAYTEKPDYIAAVNGPNIYKGGNTNTTGGLWVARTQIFQSNAGGNRNDINDVLLLVTDGKPTRDVETLQDEVQIIKDMGITILGIGVTNQINESMLMSVVSDRNTGYFTVDKFRDLAQVLDNIIQQACRIRTTTPLPATTMPPATGCTNEADLYFLLDGSGSISEINFNTIKDFTSDLIEDLSVDSGRIRVGLAVFSTTVLSEFSLTKYNMRSTMMEAVHNITYPRGTTNTAEGLSYVRQTGFNQGDRGTVPNILVLLTDGNSNDKTATLQEAYEAKKQGIHIITIGIGGWTNVYELKSVASYPSQKNYIPVQNFISLNTELKSKLRDLICNNANPCNSNPCQNGGTCLTLIDSYMCDCRSGFAGVNCQRTCRVGNDVVFALDSSGSIGEDNFLMELDFVRDIVYGINMRDSRVGVLKYADQPTVQFHLNTFLQNKMGVMNGLSMIYMGGTTNTAGAISQMRSNMFTNGNGDRGNNDNVGVVVTDGRSNDFVQTWQQATQARAQDITMLAVGVGGNLADSELQAIASYPNGPNVIKASAFDQLDTITDNVLDAVCNNINECASNPCINGECRDLSNGYYCNCQSGFSGKHCERGCNYRYDIVFVIDSSGSIGNRRFPDVLDMIVSVIENFDVGPDKARIGAILFSDDVDIRFNLNQYSTMQDVITGIRTSLYIGGRTNIASALETVKNQMFSSSAGDRSDVDNYVILLTDGASNIREGEAVKMAVDMRVDGAKISVVGIGSNANTLELRGMSSSPLSEMMMMAESFTDIKANEGMRNQIVNSIVESTCDEVNECNSSPCSNGGNCVDDLHMFWCECNPDFTGQTCTRRCTNQMDVTLVLDFSGSLDNVFNIVIAFAKEIVYGLPVRLNRAKVAVVSYSDDAVMDFDLNKYTSKREIINSLSFSRNGGRTNTQSALSMMNNDVFTSGRGDRSSVQNIAIVVTDGGSNIQRDQTIRRAQDAKNRNINIYVAAFGEAPDMGEINGIASDPDNSFIERIPNAADVQSAASKLLDKLCQ